MLCHVISAWSQEVWTVGPMVHINFSKGQKTRVSGGIEFAYWNFNHFFHSVDGGFEFEKNKFRIYSELQTGILLTGISCGPVLEFSNTGTHVGIQGSAWLNYFLGFDYRKRWIDGKRYNSGGIYVKVPVATTGLETDGTNSSHHHGDADWHDFF